MRTGLTRGALLAWALALVLAGCAPERGTPPPEAPPPEESALPTPAAEGEQAPAEQPPEAPKEEEEMAEAKLLYQGHGSLRVTTPEGKVIYVDPYAGEGYDLPADLILITHAHADHTAVERIATQAPGCRTITYKEALVNGEHKSFEEAGVTVEAVEAGNNPGHDINVCVGYVLTLSNGKTVYLSGDTSTTDQMAQLARRELDYAFFCCDGIYNMDLDEAARCADLVGAKHAVPYHMSPGRDFDRQRAERFEAKNRLILAAGEEIVL